MLNLLPFHPPPIPPEDAYVAAWVQLPLWFPTSHPWYGMINVAHQAVMSRS